MKTLKNMLLFLLSFGLFSACEKNEKLWDDYDPAMKKGPAKTLLLTVPLKAEFSVVPEGIIEDATYPEYTHKLIMVGEGNMSHLGKISTRMIFWANQSPVGPYGHGTGVFVAANGDELYVEFDDGLIIWNQGDNADYYPTSFNDEMHITGGTGRFEGAGGCFMSNAFVHYPDPSVEGDYWHTDFFSFGTLIMEKGKK